MNSTMFENSLNFIIVNYKELFNILAAVVSIAGGIYAFIKWGIDIIKWFMNRIKHFFQPHDDITYKIPKKSIVILPTPYSNDIWWHMGSSSGKPGMQIVGRFKVTNITKYNILLVAAKMKKPRILGHVDVKDSKSNYHGSNMIPDGATTDMGFSFWIMPPVKKEKENFKADVAIIDQFGNEHWIKDIEFHYS